MIASWWDYGYWITTLSERTTLVDNSTLIDWQIKKMGYALITTPENSWHILSSSHTQDISPYNYSTSPKCPNCKQEGDQLNK